jgi:hypothetical protein
MSGGDGRVAGEVLEVGHAGVPLVFSSCGGHFLGL